MLKGGGGIWVFFRGKRRRLKIKGHSKIKDQFIPITTRMMANTQKTMPKEATDTETIRFTANTKS